MSGNDFLSMLKISADSPGQLRVGDVDRVLSAAREAFAAEKFHRFVAWLPASGVDPRTCEEINAWLDEEGFKAAVWPDFLRDTYRLTYSDRGQFEAAIAALRERNCQFIADIGYSSMVILLHKHDPDEQGSVANILAAADRLAAPGRHPSDSPFAMQRT